MSEQRAQPPVTAIVVNFNGGSRALRCIRALIAQTRPPDQIIVVDNASSDGSREAIATQFPSVTILAQTENLGPSKGRNIGLRAAVTPLALLIDCDMYLHANALETMFGARTVTRAVVVCPRIVLYPERKVIQFDGAELHFTGTYWLRNANSTDFGDDAGTVLVGGAPSGCLLLDRETALEAGGFNELYFFYYEDFEFSLRMRAFGYDTACALDAIVEHDRGEGTPGLSFRGTGQYPSRRAYLSMRNRLITICIHHSMRSALVLLPALLLYELGTLGLAVARGWLPEYCRAWSSIVRDRDEIVAHRKFVHAHRKRSDRALFTADELAFGIGVMRGGPERWAAATIAWLIGAYWRLARPLLRRRV